MQLYQQIQGEFDVVQANALRWEFRRIAEVGKITQAFIL
jgi:hypothetical protein